MKNTNKKNTNKKTNRNFHWLKKIPAVLSAAFFVAAMVMPDLPGFTDAMSDIPFFGSVALSAVFLIVYLKLQPNKDTYRCIACGHAHVPACRKILESTKHMYCPVCQRDTLHHVVADEEALRRALTNADQ